MERAMCPYPLLAVAIAHDHAAGALVAAGLVTLGRRSPRAHRVAAGSGLAFAAAVRMVDRIHRHAAHCRAYSAPAHASGLADGLEVVLFVADFPAGGAAVDVHLADLAGTQAQLRIGAFARQQLHRGPRGTRQLRAFAGQHFDAVDRGAHRHIAQRQRIADLDRRLRPVDDLQSHRHALGRDDVTALAVGVTQQRKIGAAVRVVFEALDPGGNAVLVAHEIDDAIVMLVPPALMARGDVAAVVAAGSLALFLDQSSNRLALVQVGVDDLDQRAPAGGCRFDFDERHLLGLPCCEVDLLPRLQADISLLPVPAATDKAAETLFLALHVGDLDAFHLHLEQQLHRSLDLGLGGIRRDTEDHLLILVRDVGALFRYHRREQHLHQPFLIDGVLPDTVLFDSVLFNRSCVHASISSNFAIAPLVISVLLKRSRLTGSACRGSTTSTLTRLRADSTKFSSRVSVMISTLSIPMPLTFCASCLVLGESTLKFSTTARRPSRASCDRIEARPARNILRLTLWLKFSSGLLGKILPPPRHSGLDAMPARARPVPFWRQGLRVDLAMSLRPFWARVPRRALAK